MTKNQPALPRKIQRLVEAVLSPGVLTSDLRRPEYQGHPHPLGGHCYVAVESLYHLLDGRNTGWQPMFVRHEDQPHWFLRHKRTGTVIDPTAAQFETDVPYEDGIPKGFTVGPPNYDPAEPSKRAKQVIEKVKSLAKAEDPSIVLATPTEFQVEVPLAKAGNQGWLVSKDGYRIPRNDHPERGAWDEQYMGRVKDYFGHDRVYEPARILLQDIVGGHNVMPGHPRTALYTRMYREGQRVPPIIVTEVGGGKYNTIDGSRRKGAAHAAGCDAIDALILRDPPKQQAGMKQPKGVRKPAEKKLKKAAEELKPGLLLASNPATGESVHDYSHLLGPRAKGYRMHLRQNPRTKDMVISVHEADKPKWAVGMLTGNWKLDQDGEIAVSPWAVQVEDEHRRKGLGLAMYEALFAHGHHTLGASRVSGTYHSTAAAAVHEKLARKHGLSYHKEPAYGGPNDLYHTRQQWQQAKGDDDGRFRPYKYELPMKHAEHHLPGSLSAEGYRLLISHHQDQAIGTVLRGGHVVGHVEVHPGGLNEEWAGGKPHRIGLRDAVLDMLHGHGQGEHRKDGWHEPLWPEQRIVKSEDLAKMARLSYDTPEFKQWFGGSRVVNPDGSPRVVYHGTDTSFTAFDPTRSEVGTHFSGDGRAANYFASMGNRGQMYPVHLSIKNPLVVPDLIDWGTHDLIDAAQHVLTPEQVQHLRTVANDPEKYEAEADAQGIKGTPFDHHFKQALLARGYDGLQYTNTAETPNGEPEDAFVIFHPHQAKSVFNNQPTPHPDMSKAEPQQQPAVQQPPPQPQVSQGPPQGSHITTPHPSYAHAAAAKPKPPMGIQAPGGDRNLWVRNHPHPSNAGRTLMVQFSSDLLQGGRQRDASDDYYDKLYQNREGYHRADDFWEVPQWQAHLAHSMPDADHYTVRSPEEAVEFIKNAGYKNVAFSALDVNRDFVQNIAQAVPNQQVVVGGYTDMTPFQHLPNVQVHPSIQSFVEQEGREYRPGYDYRHFLGTKTIPRLTLSDGCRHQCTFCAVPKRVEEKSRDEILQQADAIAQQQPDLVYLNDKTFGQAGNHRMLPEIYQRIRAQHPGFKGFVVQTTAAAMKNLSPEFLRQAGIRHVELGVETFNDPILRAHKKPANEAIIEEAAGKLREAGANFIPNIMVGLPGENQQTYQRTMDFLNRHRDIISHVNAYNLALYDSSELGQKLNAISDADRDENQTVKSWHTDPQVHRDFHQALFNYGMQQLDQTPYAATPLGKAEGEVGEMPASGLLVANRSLREATFNTLDGRGSRTKGPLSVWKLDDGRHLLVDGHHRLVDHLRRHAKKPVQYKVVGQGYTDYYATPTEPFEHTNTKYGGLERFADNSCLRSSR